MFTPLLLTILSGAANAGEPRCQGALDLKVMDVPLTTYGAGVSYTTHTTTWTVQGVDERTLDTLSLARALGDTGVETELARRQAKARRVGWIVTGVAIPATLLGAGALNAGVNGDGGNGAIVGGATLLSLGGTGLIFGPVWLGLRPWALKNNPAAFYPLDEVREKLEIYDDACRS